MLDQLSIIDRIAELEAFAHDEGLTLPMPAIDIVQLEDMGHVIDLHTGQLLEDVDPDERLEIEVNYVRE